MADFDTSGGGGGGKHGGKVRAKKMSTRVDLTPLVDLAFLLISFFMLTTTLNKPKAMDLNMPKNDEPQKKTEVKESQVLNLLLGGGDSIMYYEPQDGKITDLKLTGYGADGIRDVILRKQKRVAKEHGDAEKTIVLIKMAERAKYKNMVDILDEMDITKTKIYAIQDIFPIEQETIDNGGKVKAQ
jgi:biopolymer transport protein ExbD